MLPARLSQYGGDSVEQPPKHGKLKFDSTAAMSFPSAIRHILPGVDFEDFLILFFGAAVDDVGELRGPGDYVVYGIGGFGDDGNRGCADPSVLVPVLGQEVKQVFYFFTDHGHLLDVAFGIDVVEQAFSEFYKSHNIALGGYGRDDIEIVFLQDIIDLPVFFAVTGISGDRVIAGQGIVAYSAQVLLKALLLAARDIAVKHQVAGREIDMAAQVPGKFFQYHIQGRVIQDALLNAFQFLNEYEFIPPEIKDHVKDPVPDHCVAHDAREADEADGVHHDIKQMDVEKGLQDKGDDHGRADGDGRGEQQV